MNKEDEEKRRNDELDQVWERAKQPGPMSQKDRETVQRCAKDPNYFIYCLAAVHSNAETKRKKAEKQRLEDEAAELDRKAKLAMIQFVESMKTPAVIPAPGKPKKMTPKQRRARSANARARAFIPQEKQAEVKALFKGMKGTDNARYANTAKRCNESRDFDETITPAVIRRLVKGSGKRKR